MVRSFAQQKNFKCSVCELGYYADEINGTCLNKCGTKVRIKEEECDDVNLVKGDGCDDQCKLENNYIFLNCVSILPKYPKPLMQSPDISQIYSGIRLFQLSYTTPNVRIDGFQIKDYLSLHISSSSSIEQVDQSYQLTQDTSQINEFNQSELNLMINITFNRSSQGQILLIKFLNTSVIYSNEVYSQIETEYFKLSALQFHQSL
ncbi:unnamed protein product [Paramecium sonneborni]|uniref:Uncharacterized protein n=1 Tax=Paramecium sonneborni TaxID=65129 RepID=A0A8S1PB68_9CILI|nr:unnamed protein product [Paramecium sonneborni]